MPEHPGDAGGQLRGAPGRRGPRAHQHQTVRGGGPLHLRPLRSEDARHRHRVPDRTGTGTRLAAHRRRGRGHHRSTRPRPARRRRPRHHLLRPVHGARLGRTAALDDRRRDEPDLDQLHIRDDGHPQGRDVRAPRRLPEFARRDHPPAVRPRKRLPVDVADVPLQRLVHPVGGHRDRRDARVPAGRAPGRDLAAPRRRTSDPSRRRPDGADDDRQRAAGPPPRSRVGRDRRRRPTRANGDHPHARAGRADRARLRDDRGVRPLRAQRVADRLVGATARRPGPPPGPPGRGHDPGRPHPGGR